MLLKDKTSVITGCNRGIGLEVLKKFAENGSNVFACYRNKKQEIIKNCEKLSKKHHVKIYPLFFDLGDQNEIKASFEELNKNCESIDVMVNNAGVIQTSLFQMTKIQEFFETAPRLEHTFKVTNPNTGVESEYVLRGLQSFFG